MHLPEDSSIKYSHLYHFEVAMNRLEIENNWLASSDPVLNAIDSVNKVIVFHRAGLLWIFNFHPVNKYSDYRVGVFENGR